MDASSKIPEGILFGTFSTFGSYDECIAIKTPKSNMQIPYTGKYCSINIQPALPENERHFTIQKAFRRYPKLQKVFQVNALLLEISNVKQFKNVEFNFL